MRIKKFIHKSPFYVDVILDGKWICQLQYTKKGFPEITGGGEIKEFHRYADIRTFVEERRPSLAGKLYECEITEQRVWR